MPFKSDKQRRFMNWAAAHGKIKKPIVDEFNKASVGMHLPEKAPKPKFAKLKKLLKRD